MDEFKNENIENVDEEISYQEEPEIIIYDEETEENIIEELPQKTKKGFKGVIAASLVFCMIVGTVVGFNVGKYTVKNDNGVILATNYAKDDNEKLKEIAEKEGQELSTQEIAVKAGPAVVGVLSKVQSYNFWGQATTGQTSGSGVVVSQDGYIVTNYHVIEGAMSVQVVLNSGVEYDAKVVGYDQKSDIAVLKIEEKDLTFVTFGDSSAVMVGDRAVAIGNPLGTELMGTVTQGIISAVNRTVTVEDKTMTLIQTDAAINSGNSGGALLNAYGELIGINTVKMAATGVEGLGFAIPSNQVKEIVDDVMQYGYVRGRLVIGVSGTNITERLAQYYDLPVGFYVNEVAEGYGAYLAGVQPGDVIIKCDGVVTKNIDEINAQRDKHKVGDIMSITVVRNGETKTLNVKLMEEVPNR